MRFSHLPITDSLASDSSKLCHVRDGDFRCPTNGSLLDLQTHQVALPVTLRHRFGVFTAMSTHGRVTSWLASQPSIFLAKTNPSHLRRLAGRLKGNNWEWAEQWTGHSGRPEEKWDSAAAAARDWEARWEAQRPAAASTQADNVRIHRSFRGRHLRLYESLAKAEGAVLCQARTERIGLRAFLFRRGVPGIASPACPCGQGDQTAAHLFAECTDPKSRAMRAMGFSTKDEVWKGLSDHRKAPGMARILISSGWLP